MKTETDKSPDLIDFIEPDKRLINRLNHFMINEKIYPDKLFIVGKRDYLLVYQHITSNGFSQEDFEVIKPKHLKRGEILDSFSKIELIINEIIDAKILSERGFGKRELSDLCDRVDLSQKIHLLKSWNLISENTFKLLHKVRSVRNVLSHSWHIKQVIYEKDQTLETNFPKFQEDLKIIWQKLINVYDSLRPQNKEMENTLKEMEELIKENETKTD